MFTHVSYSKDLRAGAILAFLALVFFCYGYFAGGSSALTDEEMALLVGSGAGPCKNCHYLNQGAFDECQHPIVPAPVPCTTDVCLHNVSLMDGCDLGRPQGCTAVVDAAQGPGILQYVYEDQGCTYGTQSWHGWYKAYYGGNADCDCSIQPVTVSCDKTNGACGDGDPIDTHDRLTMIDCTDD